MIKMNNDKALTVFLSSNFKVLSILPYLSLFIWSLSLYLTKKKPIVLENPVGLASYLHPIFFFALLLLTISFMLNFLIYGKKYLFFIQIFFLIVMLYLTPIFLENTIRGSTIFWYYSATSYILDNHCLNVQLIQYHSWPGFFIVTASYIYLTKIDPLLVLGLYAFFNRLIVAVLLYELNKQFNITTRDNYASIWLYISIQSLDRQYFNAPSFAFLLYLIGVAYILKFVKNSLPKKVGLLIIITLFSLSTSHILLPIILSLNGIFIGIKAVVLNKKIKGLGKKKRFIFLCLFLLILIVTVIVSVMIFPFFNSLLRLFFEQNNLFRDPILYIQRFIPYVPKYNPLAPILRYIVFAVLVSFVIMSLYYTIRNKININDVSILLILITSTVLPIFGITYGVTTETYEIRSRIFELVSIYMILLLFFKPKKIVKAGILLLIIISPCVFIYAHYSLEKYAYTPPQELSGYSYLFNLPVTNSTAIISSILSVYYLFDYGKYLIKIPENYFEHNTYQDLKESLTVRYSTVYFIINNRTIAWHEDGGFSVSFNSAKPIVELYQYILTTDEWDLIFNNSVIMIFRANALFFA